jgi:hypothetical protein
MSRIKCKCYITYTGPQPLNLIEQKMESDAKFEHNPLSQVPSGAQNVMLFEGINHEALAVGPKGYVVYQAIDSTKFTIYFCSYATGKDNNSENYITADGNTGSWNYQRTSYKDDGREVTVSYSITPK